ncbi:MAG: hypothetical protein EBR09_13305 [Proteobacteria bacterium]|nr:hypothetical protein [Pseudomonadota bacterium]
MKLLLLKSLRGITFAAIALISGTSYAGLVCGDLNSDGRVNQADSGILQAHVSGKQKIPVMLNPSADVDGNGRVDSADGELLTKFTLGTFPGIALKCKLPAPPPPPKPTARPTTRPTQSPSVPGRLPGRL